VRFAQVVSVLFHPLLLTTYLVVLLGFWAPEVLMIRKEFYLKFTLFIFGITFLLPALNIFFFRQLRLVGSFKMESRKERVLPFVFNALLYVLMVLMLVHNVQQLSNFIKLMTIIAALAVTAAISTFFMKISIHSLSWAGLIGILIPLNRAATGALLVPTIVLIIVAGTVMSSRLLLNAHSPREIWTGCFSGLLVGTAGMFLLF
jgi:hypothetical protein